MTEVKKRKLRRHKRTWSRHAAAARARAGALLGINYDYLRTTCPQLPQTGYLSRAKILEGAVAEIRSLQEEIRYLNETMMTTWRANGVQGPRLPELIPVGSHGHQETREWNENRFLQPDLTVHSRGENQLPLLQPGSVQIIDVRSGGELLRPDIEPTDQPESLQIIDVRGGSELLQVDPSLTDQVRSGKQLELSTLESGQVTRGRGGDEANVLVKGSAALAHARGGGSQERQGDDHPEVVVLWQGAVKLPVQAVPPSTRPFLAGSPPLEERSWMPTQAGVSWKSGPEKINLFSSTLERVSSSPVKRTLVSPITLEIPNTSSGVTREDDMFPMDLTCRRRPLKEMLRECLMRASPPKPTPGGKSQRESSTRPPPPLSGDSFMNLPVHEIVKSLQPPQPPEEVTPTVRDSMISGVKEVMLNTPVTNVDNGGSRLMTSVATRTCLWSPAEDLKWPSSPPLTRGPMTSSLGDPGQVTSPSLATPSLTVTAQPTRTLRVAKWVGDLEGQRREESLEYGPVKNQDMDISVVEETKDDENSLVEVDVDLVKETGFTINIVRDEVEDITIQAETDKTEDNKMVVDVAESIVTSDEISGKTVDAEKQGEETELQFVPESITKEYVEEELDVKKMSEDKPEEREHQHRLIEDTKVKIETSKDLEQKKEVGDLKTQPKTITPWPKYIYSHRGNIEDDNEDIFTWPSSPTSQLLPGKSVLASTIPWIEVLSNDDAVRTNSIDSEEEGKGEAKETDEKDEREEIETFKTTKAEVRSAYVAIRKLRFPGLRLIGKTLKQKQKKKTKRSKTKWILHPDSKDKDWIPPRTGKKKLKAPAKIKLVKRRPVSDDEDDLWQQNNCPNYRQPSQRQKWAGTTVKTQSELMKFYKSLQELGMEEEKRVQEERLKEERLEAQSGVMTTSTPGDGDEDRRDLRDGIDGSISEVREEASPRRQRCLRCSGSDGRTGEAPAGRQLNEQERWESLETDLEEAKVDVEEDSIMEGPDNADSITTVNVGDIVDKDTEKDSREESIPIGEEKAGRGGEADFKEKVGRGGEADFEEGGEVPGGGECSGEGGSPGESRRTAGEGKNDEEVETIKINRSPSLNAATECGQNIQASASSTPLLPFRLCSLSPTTTCPRRSGTTCPREPSKIS